MADLTLKFGDKYENGELIFLSPNTGQLRVLFYANENGADLLGADNFSINDSGVAIVNTDKWNSYKSINIQISIGTEYDGFENLLGQKSVFTGNQKSSRLLLKKSEITNPLALSFIIHGRIAETEPTPKPLKSNIVINGNNMSGDIISGELKTKINLNSTTNYDYFSEDGRFIKVKCNDGYTFTRAYDSPTMPEISGVAGKKEAAINIDSLFIKDEITFIVEKDVIEENVYKITITGDNINGKLVYMPMGSLGLEYEHNIISGEVISLPSDDFSPTLGSAELSVYPDDGYIIKSVENKLGSLPFESEKFNYSFGGNVIDNENYTTITINTELKEVKPDPDPSDKSIMNNYLLTENELMDFQKQVYGIVNTESVNEGRGALELTNFLNSVKIFPFIISDDNLGVRESIKIRDKQLNTATRIIKDSITLNLGVIKFEKEFNNSLDYMGVKIEVFLPFCNGSISLQPSEVIGKDIIIIANVNVYDGAVTINFKDAETYINISSANFGANFPFFNLYDIKQSDLNPTQAVNTLLQAYALVTKPNYVSGRKMATRQGKLIDDNGYIEMIDISLKTDAYLEEKQQIISLLNRGVKIC